MTTALITQPPSEIAVYDRIADPVAFIENMGITFAKSGMFGCSNEQQGKVLAMTCLAENKTPTEIARVYHIIGGKMSMRADAMLAEYRKLGGKVKWLTPPDDETKCEADWTHEGETYRIGYKIEEAKKAGLIKAGSGWVKNPCDMLRARAITRAVRMITPEVCAGYYAPEELDDADDKKAAAPKAKSADEVKQLLDTVAKRGQSAVAANPAGPGIATAATTSTASNGSAEKVIDAEVIESSISANGAAGHSAATSAAGSPNSTAAATTPTAAPFLLTSEQVQPLLAFAEKFQLGGSVLKPLLDECGVQNFKQLTVDQFNGIFDKLKAKYDPPASAFSESAEFCTAEQKHKIESLYVDLGVGYDAQQNILKKRNAESIRNLTATQATEIIVNLTNKLTSKRLAEPLSKN